MEDTVKVIKITIEAKGANKAIKERSLVVHVPEILLKSYHSQDLVPLIANALEAFKEALPHIWKD